MGLNDLATVRIDLGINAQHIISQLQIHNKSLEDIITKGLEKAINELLEEDNFEQIIITRTKEAINNVIRDAANDWSLQRSINESIRNIVETKINTYIDKWSDKLLENLQKE